MKTWTTTLMLGFALFSMFFGSGNLVFPIQIGAQHADHPWLASAGIVCSGVLLPFLAIWAIYLHQGSPERFFTPLGKVGATLIPLLLLSLLGPFGVIPRCITVAHGSTQMLFTQLSLAPFSLLACLGIFLLTGRKDRVVKIIGSILTPVLLLSLGAMSFAGLWTHTPTAPPEPSQSPFLAGVLIGYQMMDLCSAFFFSGFAYQFLASKKELLTSERILNRMFGGASLIGMLLLATLYFSMVFLGSSYHVELSGVLPEKMLAEVAQQSLGSFATPLFVTSVSLACLTTATALSLLFAEFVWKSLFHKRISLQLTMLATLATAFAISTLSFSGIAQFLGPTVDLLYPCLIVYTTGRIVYLSWP